MLEQVKKTVKGAAALTVMAAGRGYTTQAAATARAAVCATCPENMKDADSLLISLAAAITESNNKSTPYDDELGTCRMCDCALRVLVHADPKLIGKQQTLPDGCWKPRA